MPTCPNCGSSDCHRHYSISHHRHYHQPHFHPPHFGHSQQSPSLAGLAIVGLVIGGIALIAKAMDNAEKEREKNKKFHLVNYKCGSCDHTFEDWDAEKASIDWKFENLTSYEVHFSFYSSDRSGYVWPGDNKVYFLDPHGTHTYSLQGLDGEKICYGAWYASNNQSSYWGVGRNNKYGCKDCCYTLEASRRITGNTRLSGG
jgi:hypothetical protein